jgi:UDP-N-acetylmuramoyl-L-alanyl-D-glutamate--2,6-diaminopimelate ligase
MTAGSVAYAPQRLGALLDGLAGAAPAPAPQSHRDFELADLRSYRDIEVQDLCLDSRYARPGSLFLALPGHATHGLEFVTDAARRGAHVVLWDAMDVSAQRPALPAGVVGIAVPALRQKLGALADRFFGMPSAHLRLWGVTGTNGKTTCAYLLAQCLQRLGAMAAYIGTIGIGCIGPLAAGGTPGSGAALGAATHTTPDVVSLHRTLAGFAAQGVTDVAIEVSSHALDQGRIDAVRLHAAAFTNLTRDHLDYHGSMQAYGAAKARLFDRPGLEFAVINVGDAFGSALAERLGGTLPLTAVWVGAAAPYPAPCLLYAVGVRPDARGIDLTLAGSFGALGLRVPLIGRFNAENAVVVLGCLTASGVPLEAAADALAGCTAAPGRMELIAAAAEPSTTAAERPTAAAEQRSRPLTVVDYAHTPDALEKALKALREHCSGALWCVFGCGGDRDQGKRALMGEVADRCADRIIVTDDNPRSEDPGVITAAIVSAIKTRPFAVIHDRAAAIAAAVTAAAAEDAVLIAGKGHEDYQIYGATRRRFSDRDEARRLLTEAA